MIGNSLEAYIHSAINFGMHAIYFNPKKVKNPIDVPLETYTLNELKHKL